MFLPQQTTKQKMLEPLLKGRICKVKWVMNSGVETERTIRLWSKSGITYWPFVCPNPLAHLPEYVTCEDIYKKQRDGEKLGWININTNSVISVKANGWILTVLGIYD